MRPDFVICKAFLAISAFSSSLMPYQWLAIFSSPNKDPSFGFLYEDQYLQTRKTDMGLTLLTGNRNQIATT
jgi:hypothetical protein